MKTLDVMFALIHPRSVRLPYSKVRDIFAENEVEPWFTYIFLKRYQRWDLWETSNWIKKNLPTTSYVLEMGCGCAFNLVWLAQNKFNNLFGSDIQQKNITAAKAIANLANTSIALWVDDGLEPKFIPRDSFDVIMSLNWTFLLEEFDLSKYLNLYFQYLRPNGVLILDVIDNAYNSVQNNQYKTSDWNKPESLRSKSEYKKRYSKTEVINAVTNAGLKIITTISNNETVPKIVYILRRS